MDLIKEMTDRGVDKHGKVTTNPEGTGVGIEIKGGDGHVYRFAAAVPTDVSARELDALAMILTDYADEKAAL